MEREGLATAVVGGGCFWCIEAVFLRIDGIEKAVSGYAGGSVPDPDYRQVCTGKTGHAEVVRLSYDPDKISYREILDLFFRSHDPTTPNRQGADVGTQYRSIILYADDEERRVAEEARTAAAGEHEAPIVTEIAPLERFYPAEEYHQGYYDSNPNAGYCTFVIQPKLRKLGLEWRSIT